MITLPSEIATSAGMFGYIQQLSSGYNPTTKLDR